MGGSWLPMSGLALPTCLSPWIVTTNQAVGAGGGAGGGVEWGWGDEGHIPNQDNPSPEPGVLITWRNFGQNWGRSGVQALSSRDSFSSSNAPRQ